MKTLQFLIWVILFAAACNNSEVVDPKDPVDDPLDTNLIEIKSKWKGDYIGTVNLGSFSPSHPPIYDTLYNQKIAITNFTRDSIFTAYMRVSMIFNDTYIDTGYYGLETALLSDTALLIRFDEAFSHSHSEMILNDSDHTLVTDYSSFPYPGGGNTRHGIYERQ